MNGNDDIGITMTSQQMSFYSGDAHTQKMSIRNNMIIVEDLMKVFDSIEIDNRYFIRPYSGFYMKKNSLSEKEGNGFGFKYNAGSDNDRFVIHQYEDGSGSYWYWNRAGNSGVSSDRRMKENIEDISQEDTDFIMKLRPRRYKLKDTETDCCHYGLIAQEVLKECKTMHQRLIVHNYEDYLADSNTDKMLGLSYESFIPLLIKVVQDQQTKIDSLECKLKASDGKQVMLYSDSIAYINEKEVFTDGLREALDLYSVVLHLMNTNQYLLKEIEKLKYLVNIKI